MDKFKMMQLRVSHKMTLESASSIARYYQLTPAVADGIKFSAHSDIGLHLLRALQERGIIDEDVKSLTKFHGVLQRLGYYHLAEIIEEYYQELKQDLPEPPAGEAAGERKELSAPSSSTQGRTPHQDLLEKSGKHNTDRHLIKGRLDEVVSPEDIWYLSRELHEEEWKYVGRHLGLTVAEIDQIRMRGYFYGTERENFHGMLLHWIHKEGQKATKSRLINSLVMEGREDLAEYLRSDAEDSRKSERQKQPSTSSFLDKATLWLKRPVHQETNKRKESAFTQAAAPGKKTKPQGVQDEDSSCGVAQGQSPDCSPSLETKACISKTGGMLQIPNTGIVLIVPPNALPEGMEQCEIQMRVIPHIQEEDQVASFASNSSAVVELLPNNLMLQHSVKLTIPHCLVLQETKDRTAKIFLSHHETGYPPHWEEQTDVSYQLEDTLCSILLDNFCWVKYSVNDKIVTAKKIVVYAAGKQLLPEHEVAVVEVGYYPDLPVEDKFLQRNPSFLLVHRKTFFFRRKGKHPLKFSLNKSFPDDWQCSSADKHEKEIPYETIALSREHSFVYCLSKRSNEADNPLCIFTVSQEKGQIPTNLAVYLQKDCSPARPMDMYSLQDDVFAQAKAIITRRGGTFEIGNNTNVVLEVPPDALPVDVEQCVLYMRIIPRRSVQDDITSFSSNSSVAVELFPVPDDVKFQLPMRLKLPHCLEFRPKVDRTVQISTRHHKKGSESNWEEQSNLKYSLDDKCCIIWIDQLCSVKYSVDNDIVVGKKIMVYTAARRDIGKKSIAEVEVGYYPDTPEGGELIHLNPNLDVRYKKILYYKEKEGCPLHLLLDNIFPSEWTCCFPDGNPQEIPFRMIAWSVEHSYLYILQNTDAATGNPLCKFTATQADGYLPIELVVEGYQQRTEMVTSGREINEQLDKNLRLCFMTLKRNLASTWRDAGRYLGVPEYKLSSIRQEYAYDVEEGIYQMFISWRQTMGSEATPSKLVEALEEMERKDLADEIREKLNLTSV